MKVGFHSIHSVDSCGICWQPMNHSDVVAHNALDGGYSGDGEKHPVHRKCIKEWLKIQNQCPFCHVLLDENSIFSWKDRCIIELNKLKDQVSFGLDGVMLAAALKFFVIELGSQGLMAGAEIGCAVAGTVGKTIGAILGAAGAGFLGMKAVIVLSELEARHQKIAVSVAGGSLVLMKGSSEIIEIALLAIPMTYLRIGAEQLAKRRREI